MEIKSIEHTWVAHIEVDDSPPYMRQGRDSWWKLIGQAWEPAFECGELEAAYQAQNLLINKD